MSYSRFLPRKLNQKGHAHFVIPIVVIVLVGLIGSKVYMDLSHADAAMTTKTWSTASAWGAGMLSDTTIVGNTVNLATTTSSGISPSGTVVLNNSSGYIVNSAGIKFTIIGGIVYVNGKRAGYTSGAIEIVYVNNIVYQKNIAGKWYEYTGNVWVRHPKPVAVNAEINRATYDTAGTIALTVDAGGSATWKSLSDNAVVPADTTVTSAVRTSTNGTTWSGWTAIAQATSSQYLQIQVKLGTTNTYVTPTLTNLTLSYVLAGQATGGPISPIGSSGTTGTTTTGTGSSETGTQTSSSSPVVTYPRPGGGQWQLAFSDDFDGTGGTAANANSGANFINKTVGGGVLTGNPGLNPQKWNMGWFTGPSSVTGLGDETTLSKWGSNETQWYGPGSILFQSDGLHLRSQNVSGDGENNEMGMISTAGLLALNPANVSHGSVDASRFIDGPLMLEWQVTGNSIVDWPATWMTNDGNFSGGSQWPGGSGYKEEIDLVEGPNRTNRLRLQPVGGNPGNGGGEQTIPTGWDQNATITFTAYFDGTHIDFWATNQAGQTVQMINAPDSAFSSTMIADQWKIPQYLMFAQQSTQATAPTGDMVLHYVRIWN